MPQQLNPAPSQYSAFDQQTMRRTLDERDIEAHKKGRDIEIGKNCRAIFTDTVTGTRYALTIASGVPTWTPL